MTNVCFILYAPGAKGKFITELCEVLSTKQSNESQLVKGHPNWMFDFSKYLPSVDLPQRNLHGFNPEVEKYKFYVDTILDFSKGYNKKLFVDCHYNKLDTIKYMLETGCKVIVINHNNKSTEERHELANNFFYKNLIYNYPNTTDPEMLDQLISSVQRILEVGLGPAGMPTIKKLNEMYVKFVPYRSLPLHAWPREAKDVLYDSVYLLNTEGNINFVNHDNCLVIDYKTIGSEDMLTSLANFIDEDIDSTAITLYNKYSANQKAIPKYTEYIDTFHLNS